MTAGRFTLPPHLSLLNRRLVDLAVGRITRLMILMPPRHGKSELVSKFFPAWFLGVYPHMRVILASYEGNFAASWGRKARDVLAEHGPQLFGVSVNPDAAAAHYWEVLSERRGSSPPFPFNPSDCMQGPFGEPATEHACHTASERRAVAPSLLPATEHVRNTASEQGGSSSVPLKPEARSLKPATEHACPTASERRAAALPPTAYSLQPTASVPGSMMTSGAAGPITGKGADLLIIDDPIKNAEQAHSRVWRDKIWEWYQAVAYTRLEPGGRIVLIQTRWHADDLAGRLLNDPAIAATWHVLTLPALAEADDPLGRPPGEPLWPERFDLPQLDAAKRTLGSYWFSAMYQQRPAPASGSLFKKAWFRYWRRHERFIVLEPGPDEQPAYRRIIPWACIADRDLDYYSRDFHSSAFNYVCRQIADDDAPQAASVKSRIEHINYRFAVADLAISRRTSADFTVITAWLATDSGELVLLDLLRDRLEAPQILPAIRRFLERYHLDYAFVEKVGFQEAIIQQARASGILLRPLVPAGDKYSRAAAATVRFEAAMVYFPIDAPWLIDLEDELMAFPHADHDDQVDCVSYACNWLGRRCDTRPSPHSPLNSEPS